MDKLFQIRLCSWLAVAAFCCSLFFEVAYAQEQSAPAGPKPPEQSTPSDIKSEQPRQNEGTVSEEPVNATQPKSPARTDTSDVSDESAPSSPSPAPAPAPAQQTEPHQPGAPQTDSHAVIKTGAPVVVAGETIFNIFVRLGGYTPELRVESILNRIAELEKEPNLAEKVEQITTQENDYSTDIVAGDLTIMTVTSLDAKAAGASSRQALAQTYASKLKQALTKDIEKHSTKNRLISLGLTAVFTVMLLALLGATGWLFPRSYAVVASWRGKHIRSLKIQQARLLSQETLTDVVVGMLRIVRVFTVIILVFVYTTLVLSLFPETSHLAGELVNYFTEPFAKIIWPAILGYLPNIAFQLVISFITYYVISFTHFFFREVERGNITVDGFDPQWAESTYKIVRFLIITFAFVLIFPYLPGSGSPAFQQVSLFMGVLLSLGSTGAISHVVAGVFLTYTGAFKIGDRVKIADTVGDVVEKTLLATRIRTIKQEYITIPNALVLGSHIINYSSSAGHAGLILHTTVTIGYDVPWKTVHQLLIDAALATELILPAPLPFVLQTSLDDFFVSYQVNAHTASPHLMAVIYSELHQNIQNKFNEGGVEIMSPHYSTLRDGNKTTIPEAYLDGNYQTPPFAVSLENPAVATSNNTKNNG
ncbi:MAG: mechanosensitive ion channel family protein [Candidatus Melainabacteria bacterium]|nr:mechanosensitive ion channel family protein [Candidatus Melainabacteria bacterium]